MPLTSMDRSHESVINDALTTLFRERSGLVASSEILRVGARPDIIVRTPDGPVIVEVEFEPARTLEVDALSRLGTEIDGRKVQVTFAVAIPEMIRTVAQTIVRQLQSCLDYGNDVIGGRSIQPKNCQTPY